ncbi:hypothetical protein ACQY1Q_01975 [Tenacibaculum sp. TC6]
MGTLKGEITIKMFKMGSKLKRTALLKQSLLVKRMLYQRSWFG